MDEMDEVEAHGEPEADTWAADPLDEGERSIVAVDDWGPSEDWSDWVSSATDR